MGEMQIGHRDLVVAMIHLGSKCHTFGIFRHLLE
jgi:hypothetical protein